MKRNGTGQYMTDNKLQVVIDAAADLEATAFNAEDNPANSDEYLEDKKEPARAHHAIMTQRLQDNWSKQYNDKLTVAEHDFAHIYANRQDFEDAAVQIGCDPATAFDEGKAILERPHVIEAVTELIQNRFDRAEAERRYHAENPEHPDIDLNNQNRQGALKKYGGSQSDDFNNSLLTRIYAALPMDKLGPDERAAQEKSIAGVLEDMQPTDPLEAMMIGQMIVSNGIMMDSARRARTAAHFDQRKIYMNEQKDAARTYAKHYEAVKKVRNKGQQTVTVEHVHIYDGGKAVIGAIEMKSWSVGGLGYLPGVSSNKGLQSHEKSFGPPNSQKHFAYSHEPEVWSEEPARPFMHERRDEKWSL